VLSGVREKLERRGRAELESEGFSQDGLTVQTVLDTRYTGQSYELPVAADSLDAGEFVPLFRAAHQERYGHSDASRAVEVVNLRIKLVLPAPTIGAQGLAPLRPPGAPAPASQRDVWFDGEPVSTAVYDRGALEPGTTFTGPAVITQMDATTVIPPGWRARVDAWKNLLVESD
jgi:N-methylhydantoinase A